MTKLSIITINRDNAIGLRKTIESVANQSFKDYEYFVIDGGSTDESKNVINEYQDKLTYWESTPDKGIYNAMNKGIIKASGEYCLFLNSGDWFFDENVLTNCFAIKFSEDFVYGYQLIKKGEKLIEDPCIDIPYLSFLTLSKSHISHQCTFIKRELFSRIGNYNEENKIISDWEFLMKGIFIYGCSIRRISVEMTVYDTSGISSIEKYKKLQFEERRNFLLKQFPFFMPDYDNYEAFMQKKYIRLTLRLRDLAKKTLTLFGLESTCS